MTRIWLMKRQNKMICAVIEYDKRVAWIGYVIVVANISTSQTCAQNKQCLLHTMQLVYDWSN